MEQPIKINLGCGNRPLKGYTNQDVVPGKNIDLVFDLNGSWPIGDSSVERYMCWDVLQYLDDPIHFFQEVQRTLKPNGYITIHVPHAWSKKAQSDPLTKTKFMPEYFNHFIHESNPAINTPFVLVKSETTINKEIKWFWCKLHQHVPLQSFDIFETIKVTLKKVLPEEYEISKLEQGD